MTSADRFMVQRMGAEEGPFTFADLQGPTDPMRPVLAALGAAWVGAWIWRMARGDRG